MKGLGVQKCQQEVKEVVSLVKMLDKPPHVLSPFKLPYSLRLL